MTTTKIDRTKAKKPNNSRLLLFAFLLIALLFAYNHFGDPSAPEDAGNGGSAQTGAQTTSPDELMSATGGATSFFEAHRPSSVRGSQIVRHKAYMLSYNEEHEVADWVYYSLTGAMVSGAAGRNSDFYEDPDVSTGTATTYDYSRTGFDRGHLCPSGDIRNDEQAQAETYYMSNITPQTHEFNAGIWNDLEKQTRGWARSIGTIYVVTGPVLTSGMDKIENHKTGRKGKKRDDYNGVSVPEKFYKIIYSPMDGGHIVGYLMENKAYPEDEHPNAHIVAVDEIESLTGIDFFPGIEGEETLESKPQSVRWWKNYGR